MKGAFHADGEFAQSPRPRGRSGKAFRPRPRGRGACYPQEIRPTMNRLAKNTKPGKPGYKSAVMPAHADIQSARYWTDALYL